VCLFMLVGVSVVACSPSVNSINIYIGQVSQFFIYCQAVIGITVLMPVVSL
jgi:hypothetical protein